MNWQNVPKQNTLVRNILVPKLDVMLFLDYDQIELRLLAYLLDFYGYPELANDFREGRDLHIATACLVFKTDNPTKKERNICKNVNYAVCYGAGPKKISAMLGCSFDAAVKVISAVYSSWPGLDYLIGNRDNPGVMIQQLRDRGCLYTLWGRKLTPEYEHKALNAWIQGTAADLIKKSTIAVHKWLKNNNFESHIVAVIHDEEVIDCKKYEVEQIVVNCVPLMQPTILHSSVPIEVSAEVGVSNWANRIPVLEWVGPERTFL